MDLSSGCKNDNPPKGGTIANFQIRFWGVGNVIEDLKSRCGVGGFVGLWPLKGSISAAPEGGALLSQRAWFTMDYP